MQSTEELETSHESITRRRLENEFLVIISGLAYNYVNGILIFISK